VLAAAALTAGLLALPSVAGAATAQAVAQPVGPGVAPAFALVYRAASGEANRLTISARAGEAGGIELSDTGASVTPGPGCELLDDHALACSPSRIPGLTQPAAPQFTRVEARLGSLGDEARADVALPVRLFGGPSDDTLRGGPRADLIDGGAGRDTLAGQAGADVFAEGDESARDTIEGGADRDRLDYARRRRSVSVDLAADQGADGDHVRGIEDVTGGPSGDRLAGNSRGNTLDGRGGDDVLLGRRSADKLIGSPGGDRLVCGAGPDVAIAPRVTNRLAADCEHALLEGRAAEPFTVSVAQPLRTGRSGVVEVHLAVPRTATPFRGQAALRYRGVLLGRPSGALAIDPGRRATARIDLVGPALTALTGARRLRVRLILNTAEFTTTLRAPLTPKTGSGGTPA
jgi:hypothetical protein